MLCPLVSRLFLLGLLVYTVAHHQMLRVTNCARQTVLCHGAEWFRAAAMRWRSAWLASGCGA